MGAPVKSQIALPALLSALVALGPTTVAMAQTRPVTDETVTAKDVATTPASDLNLVKEDIPLVLLKAQDNPYATAGLRKCAQYASAIGELDMALGPDVDVAGDNDGKLKPGQVAQSVVGSFIPFRGVIREVSGARKQQQAMEDAIVAGLMRRAFLKGMGLKLGCAYPARPAVKS
jgi:hypothetical protein